MGRQRERAIAGSRRVADPKDFSVFLHSDTNWHSMLYLIRAACAMAAATATSTASNAESAAARLPTEEGIALLQETRSLLRELATDSPKAKVERGYLLGVLELARELRERQWPEGTHARAWGSSLAATTYREPLN